MRITVTTKLDEREYSELKRVAEFEGKSVSRYLKEVIEKTLDSTEEGLSRLSREYGIKEEVLVKNVEWLLNAGKIYKENGKIKWNPYAIKPDYISLDDLIDGMKEPQWKKDEYKRKIMEDIARGIGDDIHNGAGA